MAFLKANCFYPSPLADRNDRGFAHYWHCVLQGNPKDAGNLGWLCIVNLSRGFISQKNNPNSTEGGILRRISACTDVVLPFHVDWQRSKGQKSLGSLSIDCILLVTLKLLGG